MNSVIRDSVSNNKLVSLSISLHCVVNYYLYNGKFSPFLWHWNFKREKKWKEWRRKGVEEEDKKGEKKGFSVGWRVNWISKEERTIKEINNSRSPFEYKPAWRSTLLIVRIFSLFLVELIFLHAFVLIFPLKWSYFSAVGGIKMLKWLVVESY